ncbi:hypothetical protein JCM11641_000488 [Rhodosporidiobolus odoratus]
MNEKDNDALSLPAHPTRAYTSPGRPQAALPNDSFARSLSQAELGTIEDVPGEEHIVSGTVTEEPASVGGGEVPGAANRYRRGSEGPRRRRPKPVRASSAPAAPERVNSAQRSQSEPTPGLIRKGTQALASLATPAIPVAKPPGWRSSCRNIVTYSWLNLLLVFVPVSWAMHFSHQSSVVTFVMSAIAIVPLAGLLGFATEDLALRVGETLGGLLNATFGNAVELIIAILALVKGELDVVRSSMLGSILSNCLLVLGMCYFAGGVRFHEQTYSIGAAHVNLNMLILSVVAFIIPVAFHAFVEDNATETIDVTDDKVLKISHGVAIVLLFAYLGYLTFTLWTHAYLYAPPAAIDPNAEPSAMPIVPVHNPLDGPVPPEGAVFRIPSLPSWGSSSDNGSSDTSSSSSSSSEDSLDHHVPKLSGRVAILLLLFVTVITGVTAEWLVSSIEGLVEGGGVSEQFVSLILLPIIGNAAEHVTAVTVATKNKLDLSITVAIGSSVQIALLVVPILVLLGWCIGQPLTFYFDEFETVVLFLSIVAVSFAASDGRTNWLEGFCLCLIYLIIALVFFYYDPTGSTLQ